MACRACACNRDAPATAPPNERCSSHSFPCESRNMPTLARGTAGALIFVEGPPGEPLLQSADDVTALLEQCFAVPTRSALLYAANLPPGFFDVSSQQAGTFLQKLRNYGLRVAVVAPADSVPMSHPDFTSSRPPSSAIARSVSSNPGPPPSPGSKRDDTSRIHPISRDDEFKLRSSWDKIAICRMAPNCR
jgi:hypothetical protein